MREISTWKKKKSQLRIFMEMTFSKFLMCQTLSSILSYRQDKGLEAPFLLSRVGAQEVMTLHSETAGSHTDLKSKAPPLLQRVVIANRIINKHHLHRKYHPSNGGTILAILDILNSKNR